MLPNLVKVTFIASFIPFRYGVLPPPQFILFWWMLLRFYLRDCLSPIIYARPIWSGRLGMLQVLSIKWCHLSGPQKCTFTVAMPVLWNKEIWMALILLLFRRSVKTQLFIQAFREGEWSPILFELCSFISLFLLYPFLLVFPSLLLSIVFVLALNNFFICNYPESLEVGDHINVIKQIN